MLSISPVSCCVCSAAPAPLPHRSRTVLVPFLCLLARYVTHYTTTGVLVEGGHETHVHDSWFGEYGWGEAGGHGHQNITGVALEIAGQVYYSMPNAVCESVHSAPVPLACA